MLDSNPTNNTTVGIVAHAPDVPSSTDMEGLDRAWQGPRAFGRFALEHSDGKAIAIVKYMHENAQEMRPSHPSVRAMADLADRTGLPVFLVRYADDFEWWYVTPLNERARELLPEARKTTEVEWVEILYRCRGRELPQEWRQQA